MKCNCSCIFKLSIHVTNLERYNLKIIVVSLVAHCVYHCHLRIFNQDFMFFFCITFDIHLKYNFRSFIRKPCSVVEIHLSVVVFDNYLARALSSNSCYYCEQFTTFVRAIVSTRSCCAVHFFN